MELAAYIVMAAGAYVALIARNSHVVYGWFVLFVIYSVLARLSPHTTGDMLYYYAVAESGTPPFTFFFLREPVLWFGSSLLYQLTTDRIVTFLIIDMFGAVVVLIAMDKLDDGNRHMFSLAPTIMCSYVLLFGQQNTFRQHLAFAILLLALAARSRNQRTGLVLFVLSVLTHNATAVLFGYWFDVGRTDQQRRYGPLITLIGVVLMGVFLPFIRKSAAATGLDTGYLYVGLVGVIGGLLMYANAGRGAGVKAAAALLSFMAFLPSMGFLASAQFERISMMYLVVILVDVYRLHHLLRLRESDVAHLAYGILVIPVFLFPSALGMLL